MPLVTAVMAFKDKFPPDSVSQGAADHSQAVNMPCMPPHPGPEASQGQI